MNVIPDTPPSPFIEGSLIQFAWDSTSLSSLKRCPRLYYYDMIEGWSSREESVHLRFGIEYHQAFSDYELSRAAGVDHDDAVRNTIRELLARTTDWDFEHGKKTRSNLIRCVIWHLDKFADDQAETYVLASGKPAVELSFRFELDWAPNKSSHPYVLCGHLDRVVRLNGELYVMDYKTTTYDPSPWYFQRYEPDNQMTLYSLAAKVVLDSPVRGVIVDAVKVQDSPVFGRGFTLRDPEQLEEWLDDLHYWLNLAQMYARTGKWPMNDTACDKFGGCKYREICSRSPHVRRKFLEGNFYQLSKEERWNPLRIR